LTVLPKPFDVVAPVAGNVDATGGQAQARRFYLRRGRRQL